MEIEPHYKEVKVVLIGKSEGLYLVINFQFPHNSYQDTTYFPATLIHEGMAYFLEKYSPKTKAVTYKYLEVNPQVSSLGPSSSSSDD